MMIFQFALTRVINKRATEGKKSRKRLSGPDEVLEARPRAFRYCFVSVSHHQ